MSATVQIDKSALKEKAAASFNKKAKDSINSLCRCWPHVIKIYLRSLNKTIEAGRAMGVVSEIKTFNPEEIEQIATELGPLAELEMHDEMRSILIPIMREKGFGDKVLGLSEVPIEA